jgi:hypothetical protein
VTYVAGPATVQLRLNVIPRNPTTSSGVNFTSARPFPFALVSSVAVGMTRAGPVQSRLVGKTFRNLLPRSLLRLRSGRVDYGDINGLLPGRALVRFRHSSRKRATLQVRDRSPAYIAPQPSGRLPEERDRS